MELLLHLDNRGFPAEYVLSRIRAKRSYLVKDWKSPIFNEDPESFLASPRYTGFVKDRSPEGLWRDLVIEYRWVYFQLNDALRNIFHPFYLYTELRTLFICLRHIKDGSPLPAGLLDASLFSPDIKEVLSGSSDVRSAVDRLEPVFCSLSDSFHDMGDAFDAEGMRGLEQFITHTYLSVTPGTIRHPLMRDFFARLIDTRNILRTYKCVALQMVKCPPLIPGGTIAESRFAKVLEQEDLFGVSSLIRKFSGIKIEAPDPTKVEIALYRAITRFLKKEGRDPLGTGPILDYLWKCSIEVMNLSVLFAGKDVDREAVSAELVL